MFRHALGGGIAGAGLTISAALAAFLYADPQSSISLSITEQIDRRILQLRRAEYARGDKRPNRIILMRHGRTHGYSHTCDCRVAGVPVCALKPDTDRPLTDEGKLQALQAGVALKQIIGDESVTFFCSPYKSCRQTFQYVSGSFDTMECLLVVDPILRNQATDHFQTTPSEQVAELQIGGEGQKGREKVSTFYYRHPNGESAADVYDRVSGFFETMYRKWEMPDRSDNFVLITHNIVAQMFLLRWFRWDIETLSRLKKFKGGQVAVMEKQNDGSYKLTSPVLCESGPPMSAVKLMRAKE